mgnify:CR=1 FL=1
MDIIFYIFVLIVMLCLLWRLVQIVWTGVLAVLGFLQIIWLVASFPFRCICYGCAFLYGLYLEFFHRPKYRRYQFNKQTAGSKYSTQGSYENGSGFSRSSQNNSEEQQKTYQPPKDEPSQEERYLQILELSRTTLTRDNLKKNYRRLAKQYHPDKNPNNPSAEEKFKLLTEAYDYFSERV